MADHDPDDLKLVTLARSSRARNGAPEGAAVRDEMGRTYVATTVGLQALTLTALEAAVSAAVSSGAKGIEAVALVTSTPPEADHVQVARELAVSGALMLIADPSGTVASTLSLAE